MYLDFRITIEKFLQETEYKEFNVNSFVFQALHDTFYSNLYSENNKMFITVLDKKIYLNDMILKKYIFNLKGDILLNLEKYFMHNMFLNYQFFNNFDLNYEINKTKIKNEINNLFNNTNNFNLFVGINLYDVVVDLFIDEICSNSNNVNNISKCIINKINLNLNTNLEDFIIYDENNNEILNLKHYCNI